MTFTSLVLGGIAVWRVAQLVARDDGPWQLFARLRRRAESSAWERLLSCINCLSLWVAAPVAFALGENWLDRLLAWPALSGVALVVDRFVQPASGAPAVVEYLEEDNNGMLRAGKNHTAERSLGGAATPRLDAADES